MSLASQQEALAKAFGGRSDIDIVGIYEEAMSAKTPGRPLFAEVLTRIEAGEADGIAAWAPDRLARNSIDGGRVIYMLDQGLLRDLKFATYTFENNSQGKFMLSILFGQSKYYSDALSENVKRGNATKIAMGWRPNKAPLGYCNCPVTKTTIRDPVQFPIIRHVFDLFLTGAYTPRQIVLLAQNEWGFMTPRARRSGGRPLGRSTIYRTLSNPFYKGEILWGGVSHAGRHEPMLTAQEFDRVQALLNGRAMPRPQRVSLAYSGVMTCGRCGKAVTAERKTNRHGRKYIYYHCAARGRLMRGCDEPSVEERQLDRQFGTFLASLRITRDTAAWARDRLASDLKDVQEKAAQFAAARLSAMSEIGTQLRELTSLRLRRMVGDEEFVQERNRLEKARMALDQAKTPSSKGDVIELFEIVEKISNHAVDWFGRAENDQKSRLLKTLCSNPVLIGKKLSVEAAKPFLSSLNFALCPRLLGDVDEVRTFTGADELLIANINALIERGEARAMIARLTELDHLFEQQDRLPKAEWSPTDAPPSPERLQPKSSRQSRPRKPQ